MKKIREGLLGNFIPLDRAVQAIGARIVVTTGEIDGYRSPNRSREEDDSETISERAGIGNMLRHARAAAQLLQILNRTAESRPKWYDSSQGFPLLDDSLGREGCPILIQWMKQALPPPPRPLGRWSSEAPAVPELNFRVPRSAQLGFDTDELIQFLDAEPVAHMLGEPLNSALDKGTSAAAADAPRPEPEKRNFRGIWADALSQAWSRARDKDDPVSVYAALVEIAKQAKPPYPILGFSGSEGVKWEDESADDEVGFFTVENMRNRIGRKPKSRN